MGFFFFFTVATGRTASGPLVTQKAAAEALAACAAVAAVAAGTSSLAAGCWAAAGRFLPRLLDSTHTGAGVVARSVVVQVSAAVAHPIGQPDAPLEQLVSPLESAPVLGTALAPTAEPERVPGAVAAVGAAAVALVVGSELAETKQLELALSALVRPSVAAAEFLQEAAARAELRRRFP